MSLLHPKLASAESAAFVNMHEPHLTKLITDEACFMPVLGVVKTSPKTQTNHNGQS